MGEDSITGAARELEEETSICYTQPLRYLTSYINPNNSTSHYHWGMFVDETINIVLDESEHDSYQWVDRDQIVSLDLLDGLKERLVQLLRL